MPSMLSLLKGSCGVGFIADVNGKDTKRVINLALESVANLTHRGAALGDGKTGDGSGILTKIPKKFFERVLEENNVNIDVDNLGIGVLFIPPEKDKEYKIKIEEILKKHNIKNYFFRKVPIDKNALGEIALKSLPKIYHLLMDISELKNPYIDLYKIRKEIERNLKDIHIPSFSHKLICYKGLFLAPQLPKFYLDLQDKDFTSSFAIFHQRYATNTLPNWALAQPLRYTAHNGEINTITGNRNWMKAMEDLLSTKDLSSKDIKPLVLDNESDSASLDKVYELLLLAGYEAEEAATMLVPPAKDNNPLYKNDKDINAYLEYKSLQMKPWDGPAALAFVNLDGTKIVGKLDRNGLRPARYLITKDGLIIFGSEVGMCEIEEKDIVERGKLYPGEIFVVDLKNNKIERDIEVLKRLATKKPYHEWIKKYHYDLNYFEKPKPKKEEISYEDLIFKLNLFGYSKEDLDFFVKEPALKGKEPIYSTGDDTPIPVLSKRPVSFFRYFRQRFAQVTNPPIDSIRERNVMDLSMNLGKKSNFLIEEPYQAHRLKISSPILKEEDLEAIKSQDAFKVKEIKIYFKETERLKDGLDRVLKDVENAVKEGNEIIIISDRNLKEDELPIPTLLTVGAIFSKLGNLTSKFSLIVDTFETKNTHEIACLISYGASAVCPHGLWKIIEAWKQGKIKDLPETNLDKENLENNIKKALEDGILKIMAKMGISPLRSYQRAQIFEIVGLSKELSEEYFPNTFNTIGGATLDDIEKDIRKRYQIAQESHDILPSGEYNYLPLENAEYHAFNPKIVRALHKAIRTKDYNAYKVYRDLANSRPSFIRHLLKIESDRKPIPIEEVESVDSIIKRFVIAGMSCGALSRPAHEDMAEAMNRLGAKSCSGEGGEDRERYETIKNSKIKQVASGRFGVEPYYLASAEELEIKIAQGAKPGEGGHLPGSKVTEYIAKLRHAEPGVDLISPPPHHDIYSIEDLSELIYDLKQSNLDARVAVKLVSEDGVGVVASGVAKGLADVVQISGCDGGTGASPLTSIKYAGNYWEYGLAEAQKMLIENNLRENIKVRVDGGFRTGRDVILSAILGADEYAFGTLAMIAVGCIMCRKCHTNKCPTGIATQDEKLIEKRYKGSPEDIMTLFKMIAQDVREELAKLGYRSLDEIIGKYELLKINEDVIKEFPKCKNIDLSNILLNLKPKKYEGNDKPIKLSSPLNEKILEDKDIKEAIEKGKKVEKNYKIKNTDRAIGTPLAYIISKKTKGEGLPEDTITLKFKGYAGQSFGAFLPKGVTLILEGNANDYIGKGLGGGKIIIKNKYAKENDVLGGNTILYGATSGELYIAGNVGERFAVRNSGAIAVVEGCGEHGCEYMTRGTILILGNVGVNFGAGMTGGVAYVLDENIEQKINKDYVKVSYLSKKDKERVKKLLEKHYKYTGSKKAKKLLDNFEDTSKVLRKVTSIKFGNIGIIEPK